MKQFIPIAASCLLVGGAIGYIAGNTSKGPVAGEKKASSRKVVSSSSSRSASKSDGGASAQARSGKSQTYAEISSTPGQTARLQALVELYSGLSNEEFAREAEKLDGLPFNERILSAYILFAAWAETSPYEAFSHANTKMGRAGMFVRPTILQSWASMDPKAASTYYESNKSEFAMMGMMGGGRGRNTGAGTVATEWAKQDPEAALAWAKTLGGRDAEDASTKAISQIASTDPERASRLTAELSGDALSKANTSIASEWAKRDWGSAQSFIESLPDEQRGDALGAAVESLASEDPRLAASKALDIPEGNARDRAVESVTESMAQEDPAAAAQWVLENGSEQAQSGSMRVLMGNWVSRDVQAARAFAVGQPEGALRDSAVSSYILSDRRGSPEENIQLASSITNERTRGRAIGATAMRWMAQDEQAATEFIETSESINEGTREWILNQRR